jgi:Cu/Ag efflux protein CusF
MFSRFRKTLVLAIAGLSIVTSVAFAQTQRQPMGSQTGTLGTNDAISATVAEVDQQQKTITLRMQSGESVELQVPQQLLSELSKGDSVQVSIRKAHGPAGSSGSSRQPVQPGTDPGMPRPRTQ